MPGAWRQTCTFSRVMRSAGSSFSSTSVRSIASSSAISSAAGLPLPATSPTRDHEPAVVERQDVVEVAADRVRRPAQADTSRRPARCKRPLRQHRLLDLARDLEIVLQRQPVGDLEQHQQVHQRERDEQRPACRRGTASPGTPTPSTNGSRAISTTPMPRNRLNRPISASSSDAPYTTRRAGDSFIVKATKNSAQRARSRGGATAGASSASASMPRVKNW